MSAYLSGARVIAAFARDREIRLQTRDLESAFGSFIGGAFSSTNVPDGAVPDAYRFVGRTDSHMCTVSQMSVELSVDLLEDRPSPSAAMDQVEELGTKFWEAFCSFRKAEHREYFGAILTFNLPRPDNQDVLVTRLVNSYLKVDLAGRPAAQASFQFGIAHQESGTYRSQSVDVYEIKKRSEPDGSSENNDDERIESGYEVEFDVNTMLSKESGLLPHDRHAHATFEGLRALVLDSNSLLSSL